MSNLRTLTVPPPFAGMYTEAAPGQAPQGTAPVVKNFTVHTPGRLNLRGPVTQTPYVSQKGKYTPGFVTGSWSFNNKTLVGYASIEAAAKYISPWTAPYIRAESEAKLMGSTAETSVFTFKSNTVTHKNRGGTNVVPYGNGARLGDYVYGPAFTGGTAAIVAKFGYQYFRPLVKWNPEAETLTSYVNAPKGAQYVKNHLERLWVLGGTDPTVGEKSSIGNNEYSSTAGGFYVFVFHAGGVPDSLRPGDELEYEYETGKFESAEMIKVEPNSGGSGQTVVEVPFFSHAATNKPFWHRYKNNGLEPNALFFSNQNGPATDTVGEWKAPTSGLINKIVIGYNDNNDFGVGLAVVNQNLIIFKRHSIWALYGYSPETFNLKQVTTERGCIDPHSICEADSGVYFASQNGIEFFDGSEFRTVDDSVASIVRPTIDKIAGEEGVQVPATTIGRVQIEFIGNGYLMVVISALAPNNLIAQTESWAGYLHIKSGNWCQFTSNSLGGQHIPLYVSTQAGLPFISDGEYLTPIPFVADPRQAVRAGVKLIDVDAAGAKHTIPARFQSDRVEMTSPGYVSQLHRYLLDTICAYAATDAEATLGWHVHLTGDEGQDLMVDTVAPGQAIASKYINGRRFEFDRFSEVISARLEVYLDPATALEPTEAAVFNSNFEIQGTRQRRSV